MAIDLFVSDYVRCADGVRRYASDRSILVAAEGEYRFVHAFVQKHLRRQ